MCSVIEQEHPKQHYQVYSLFCHQMKVLKCSQSSNESIKVLSVIERKFFALLCHRMGVLKWFGHKMNSHLWFRHFSVIKQKHWSMNQSSNRFIPVVYGFIPMIYMLSVIEWKHRSTNQSSNGFIPAVYGFCVCSIPYTMLCNKDTMLLISLRDEDAS